MKKLLAIALLLFQTHLYSQHIQMLMPASLPNYTSTGVLCDTAFDKLYFEIRSGQTDYPIYVTDETPQGTYPVWNNNTGNWCFLKREHVFLNNKAYYKDDDPINGVELWTSDGTDTGSYLVKNICDNPDGNPSQLTVYNNRVYFIANYDNFYYGLYGTDGTDSGTYLVMKCWPSYTPRIQAVFNNKLWFTPTYPYNNVGVELWYTDGTDTGTHLLRNINPADGSYPDMFYVMDSFMFFRAADLWDVGAENTELWKTDGTPAGTVMVKDIYPGDSVSSRPWVMTAMNGRLYFQANDGVHGKELWASDGTDTGTYMVKDIFPGTGQDGVCLSWSDSRHAVYNNRLYFVGNDSTGYYHLWSTDGTAQGDQQSNKRLWHYRPLSV